MEQKLRFGSVGSTEKTNLAYYEQLLTAVCLCFIHKKVITQCRFFPAHEKTALKTIGLDFYSVLPTSPTPAQISISVP